MIGRIAGYGGILIIAALPIIFVNDIFGYLPVLFILVMTLVSLVYTLFLMKYFVCISNPKVQEYTKGSSVSIMTQVANRSFLIYPKIRACFYLNNTFSETSSETYSDFVITPFEKKSFVFDVQFDHIGEYTAGVKSVRIYDLFGLFYFTYKNEVYNKIKIKPQLYHAGMLEIKDGKGILSASQSSKSSVSQDEYSGVREYVPGDPIKNIHWKISSHVNKYMCRYFENFSDNGMSIYLDLLAPALEKSILMGIYDCLIETAYSITDYGIDMGQEIELIYAKDGKTKINKPKNAVDNEEIISEISGLTVDESLQISSIMTECAAQRSEYDNIVVCTANLTQVLMCQLDSARLKKKNPVLFYVIPEHSGAYKINVQDGMLRYLSKRGIPYHIISSAEELSKKAGVAL